MPLRGPIRQLRDLRLWLGLAIAAACLWLVFRGVSFREVAEHVSRADWPLLVGLSVPAHVASIYVRAVRWRYLTAGLTQAGPGPLFRATAVGFMANNVFPLRIGEVVRAWYLSRESGARTSALFGTVVLERVLDTLIFLGMVGLVVALFGTRPLGHAWAGLSVVPVLLAPAAGVVVLRVAPARTLSLAAWLARPLPEALGGRLLGMLERVSQGVGALRGRRDLLWVGLHSMVLWLVVCAIPFAAGLLALGIDVGSPFDTLMAAYVTMTLVGLAIAVPSSPGFFGPYHAACWAALAMFGVPKTQAVALGTVVHGLFWVTLTLLGLAVLRMGRESLGELGELEPVDRAAPGLAGAAPSDCARDPGKDRSVDRR